jgi:hypothetical protein
LVGEEEEVFDLREAPALVPAVHCRLEAPIGEWVKSGDRPAGVDPAARTEFGVERPSGGHPDNGIVAFFRGANTEPDPAVGAFLNFPREAFDTAETVEVGDARGGEAWIQVSVVGEARDECFDERDRGAAVHAGVGLVDGSGDQDRPRWPDRDRRGEERKRRAGAFSAERFVTGPVRIEAHDRFFTAVRRRFGVEELAVRQPESCSRGGRGGRRVGRIETSVAAESAHPRACVRVDRDRSESDHGSAIGLRQ